MRLRASMVIFTSLLSTHTHVTCMWSLGCAGGAVGCRKVIAGFSARQLELDDGEWISDAEKIAVTSH